MIPKHRLSGKDEGSVLIFGGQRVGGPMYDKRLTNEVSLRFQSNAARLINETVFGLMPEAQFH